MGAPQPDISVPPDVWPSLVQAAIFEAMRAQAAAQAPDPAGVLKDPAAFFRRGSSGAGRETLSSAEIERYYARAAGLAPPGLLAWLHHKGILEAGWMEPASAG
jgi:hypothetical protein